MSDQLHNVAVRIGSKLVEKWTNYQVECDMLHPADCFEMQVTGAGKAAWDLARPDAEVQVLLDDTIVMTGRIGDRTRRVDRNGSELWITGRDKSGRLVDESMELRSFANLTVAQLVAECAKPWFTSVIFTNAANRKALRGKGARLARSSKEPALTLYDPAAVWGKKRERRVSPGERRWSVIAKHLEEIGLIAWSTADGSALVVGQPNYDQEIQYRFFVPKAGSDRIREGSVLAHTYRESVEERYSRITAVGYGRGDNVSFAVDVDHGASVNDGPGPFGTGDDFLARKTLIIAEDKIPNQKIGVIRAQREMDERNASGRQLDLTVRGHAQRLDDAHPPTLFAFDTLAYFEDEEIELKGVYLITSVRFRHARDSGETTELHLVPKGTLLKGA